MAVPKLSGLVTAGALVIGAAGAAGGAELNELIGDENFFFHAELYRFDPAWDADWYARDLGFRTTVGSISNTRFLLDLDLKARADLGTLWWFEYRLRREESYLFDTETQLGGFGVRWRSWRAGLTGLLKGDKAFTVAGLQLAWEPASDRRVTVRLLWPGIYFNDKGPEGQLYLDEPFEALAEGIWTWAGGEAFGEARIGNQWRLQTPDGVESGQQARATATVLLHRGASGYGLEGAWLDEENSFLAVGTDGSRVESLRLGRLTALYSAPLAPEWTMTARLGGVTLDGEGVDDPDEDGTPGAAFSFSRTDWIGTFEATWSLDELNDLRFGVTAGTYDLDSGASVQVDPMSGSRVFLKAEYAHRFGDQGDVVFGVSFNASETVFGGGNVRLRFVF
jgi:hypothetical protein